MSILSGAIKKRFIKRLFITLIISILLTFFNSSCKTESTSTLTDGSVPLKVNPSPVFSMTSVSTDKLVIKDIETSTAVNTPTAILSPKDSPTPALPNPGEVLIVGIDSEGAIELDNSIGYDSLQINVNLNVGEAGAYIIVSSLSTLEGELISRGNLSRGSGVNNAIISMASNFDKGLNSIFVYFSGSAIRNSKKNGPYKVNLTVYNTSNKELASIEYKTEIYNYKQFQ